MLVSGLKPGMSKNLGQFRQQWSGKDDIKPIGLPVGFEAGREAAWREER